MSLTPYFDVSSLDRMDLSTVETMDLGDYWRMYWRTIVQTIYIGSIASLWFGWASSTSTTRGNCLIHQNWRGCDVYFLYWWVLWTVYVTEAGHRNIHIVIWIHPLQLIGHESLRTNCSLPEQLSRFRWIYSFSDWIGAAKVFWVSEQVYALPRLQSLYTTCPFPLLGPLPLNLAVDEKLIAVNEFAVIELGIWDPFDDGMNLNSC